MILNELGSDCEGRFPKKAIEAAVEHQVEITPFLLDNVNRVADDSNNATEEDLSLLIFGLYLLAQFREERALLPIIKLISLDSETVDWILGDTITEGLPQILASVCHDNIEPIKQLVTTYSADEFVRGSALYSLKVLYCEDAISREAIASFLNNLFTMHPIREPDQIWDSACGLACSLRLKELLPDIQKAYRDGLIDEGYISLSEIEKDITEDAEEPLLPRQTFITDTVEEMRNWACFQPKKASSKPDHSVLESFDYDFDDRSGTIVRAIPKIGRNDPYPCGSGKKYKKCCG
jgi:hypothetical protein